MKIFHATSVENHGWNLNGAAVKRRLVSFYRIVDILRLTDAQFMEYLEHGAMEPPAPAYNLFLKRLEARKNASQKS